MKTSPRVLFVYCTYTGQVSKVTQDIASVFAERGLGVKIPPSNLQPGYGNEPRTFAGRLANRVVALNSPL